MKKKKNKEKKYWENDKRIKGSKSKEYKKMK